MQTDKPIPKITLGRYSGTPINKLPNSYLRWMISQKFPKEWLECAREKLEQSDYNNLHLNVSRHTIDMFSKRFLHLWNVHIREKGDDGDGLATFIAKLAEEAWTKGEDISRHRHQNDGIIKSWRDIQWVFNVSPHFPDFRDVITVMPVMEKLD